MGIKCRAGRAPLRPNKNIQLPRLENGGCAVLPIGLHNDLWHFCFSIFDTKLVETFASANGWLPWGLGHFLVGFLIWHASFDGKPKLGMVAV